MPAIVATHGQNQLGGDGVPTSASTGSLGVTGSKASSGIA
jgi:hypothetical protein